MKSIWVFLLGSAIHLAFIFFALQFYWTRLNDSSPFTKEPSLPFYALLFLIPILAGLWARQCDRPGLANILVMALPILTGLFFLLFFFIIYGGKFLPEGFGLMHMIVIALTIALLIFSLKWKTERLRRIFDASREIAAQRKTNKIHIEQIGPKGPKVSFSSSGRSGQVGYESPEGNFNLYYEYGGGEGVVATIYVPSQEQWFAQTGIPVERRNIVLNYIGAQAAKEQTQNGSFKLEGNYLLISD